MGKKHYPVTKSAAVARVAKARGTPIIDIPCVTLEDDPWTAERERMETFIITQLQGRARTQGWLNAKGKLTASGSTAALEFVIGMAAALEMLDHPRKSWLLLQAFLCSARGVEGRFPLNA